MSSSTVGLSRGLPSTGCNHCRARKVKVCHRVLCSFLPLTWGKCDEERPACARCSRTGLKDCEYRDRFELSWRDQTDIASERAKKTWRKRAKAKAAADAPATAPDPPAGGAPKVEGASVGGFTSINSAQGFRGFTAVNSAGWINSDAGNSNGGGFGGAGDATRAESSATATPPSYSSPVASSLSPSSAASSLSPLSMVATPPAQAVAPPADGFEDRALQRFWFDWTISRMPPTLEPDAFFPFLRMNFYGAPAGSILHEAVLALAYANYNARQESPEATQFARQHYEGVVQGLRKVINMHEPVTNPILLSVTLLAMYEVGAPLSTSGTRLTDV
jgi:hypothetical protein